MVSLPKSHRALLGIPATVLLVCQIGTAAQDGPAILPSPPRNGSHEAPELPSSRLVQLLNSAEVHWPTLPSPGEAASFGAESALPVLSRMAHAEMGEVRRRAVEGYGQSVADDRLDALFVALTDFDPAVRDAAADMLAAADPKLLTDGVLQILGGDDEFRIQALTEALPRLGPATAGRMTEVLIAPENSAEKRQDAAYCLGYAGSASVAPILTQVAVGEDTPLALVCARSLRRLGDPATLTFLVQLLSHASPDIRLNAIRGLGKLGGRDPLVALAYVAAGIAEKEQTLRDEAALQMGRTSDPGAVPLLIHVMRRCPPTVAAAAQSLTRLTGKDFGPNAGRWWGWYRDNFGSPSQEVPAAQPGVPRSASIDERLFWNEPFGLEGGMDAIRLFGLPQPSNTP